MRVVVAPKVDLVADACLPAVQGDVQDLEVPTEGLIVAGGCEVAGEPEGHVTLTHEEVAATADAERVRDVHVAAPALACFAWLCSR